MRERMQIGDKRTAGHRASILIQHKNEMPTWAHEILRLQSQMFALVTAACLQMTREAEGLDWNNGRWERKMRLWLVLEATMNEK